MIKFMHFSSQANAIAKGSGLNYPAPADSDFAWIFMQKPDEKEMEKVSSDFGIDKKYFRTFSKESRSVRYSINPLIFVFMDYYLENGQIKNSRVLFVLKENCLIIMIHQQTVFYGELFDRLVDTLQTLKKKSLVRLMYQFLMEDVDENYEVLEKVETAITDLEKGVLAGGQRAEDVIKFKRKIHRMSRRFWGSAKIVFTVKKGITPLRVDAESARLLDDVYNTYMHQIDILSSAKEMLSDVLAIHNTAVSNDLNIIIKKLTSFTVILLVPTLIAGVYGMNFQIPELRWEFGYPFALFSMIASIIVLFYLFHRKRWI